MPAFDRTDPVDWKLVGSGDCGCCCCWTFVWRVASTSESRRRLQQQMTMMRMRTMSRMMRPMTTTTMMIVVLLLLLFFAGGVVVVALLSLVVAVPVTSDSELAPPSEPDGELPSSEVVDVDGDPVETSGATAAAVVAELHADEFRTTLLLDGANASMQSR
jgi:hypothetical protein